MNETRKTHLFGPDMKAAEVRQGHVIAVVTVLSALLVAGSKTSFGDVAELASLHGYWIIRLSISALLFVGVCEVLTSAAPQFAKMRPIALMAAAAVVSAPVFTLAITALDIVLGEPEFPHRSGASHVVDFLYEILYQIDNHVAFCGLIGLVRLRLPTQPAVMPATVEAPLTGFIAALDPPLDGALLSAEAQEHYVRLSTRRERRLELCRFSDLLRELPETQGLRVHRSHWVARAAVRGAERQGPNLFLDLVTGQRVPVSRTYRKEVETLLAERGVEF